MWKSHLSLPPQWLPGLTTAFSTSSLGLADMFPVPLSVFSNLMFPNFSLLKPTLSQVLFLQSALGLKIFPRHSRGHPGDQSGTRCLADRCQHPASLTVTYCLGLREDEGHCPSHSLCPHYKCQNNSNTENKCPTPAVHRRKVGWPSLAPRYHTQ